MNPVCRVVLFIAIVGFIPLARGQAVLNKTSLGQSQSDERDLANSLVTAPQKYGKGEKKSQVSAAELKSKSIKDATFGGSLLNIGIDPAAPKLDATKEHSAPSEGQLSARTASTEHVSSASKQSEATEQGSNTSNQSQPAEANSTFSNLSQTALLSEDLAGSSDVTVAPAPEARTSSSSSASKDKQKKDQAEAEKPSTTSSTEKSSTTKPDGDH